MQSHRNGDSDLPDVDFEKLRAQAEDLMGTGESSITAGSPGEGILKEWEHRGVVVRKLPNDDSKCVRVSIGGGKVGQEEFAYCVYRGEKLDARRLLVRALEALMSEPKTKKRQ